jgi:hypothetical protein
VQRIVQEDRTRFDTDEVEAKKERGRQVGVAQVHFAFHLNELFELLRRAEPLDAALQIAADGVPKMLARHFLTTLVAPFGKAELEVDVDDALAAAGNLVEEPAEAVAQTRDETVWQDREQLEEADAEMGAEAA